MQITKAALLPMAGALLLGLGAAALPQDGYTVVPLNGAVSQLRGGQGGNLVVSAGEDGVLLVDDQFARLAGQILAAIEPLSEKGLQFVVNTHLHPDHTGGNEILGGGAWIVAHDKVRDRLEKGYPTRRGETPPAPESALPVLTFEDRISLHFNGEEIRVIHLPHRSHTDTDSVVWFTGADVLHTGDQFVSGGFPFIDRKNGGDAQGLLLNLEAVLGMISDDTILVPGHGAVSTRADLAQYRAILAETVALIRERHSAGQSLDEAKEAGLPEKYDSYGTGFIDTPSWIESVYHSVDEEADLTRDDPQPDPFESPGYEIPKGQPQLHGSVMAVQYDPSDTASVQLDIGADVSVKVGYVFDVFRGDTYKGQIRVESVSERTCEARLVLPTSHRIKKGDRIATRI